MMMKYLLAVTNAPEGEHTIGHHLPLRRLRVIVRGKYHLEDYV